MSFSDMDATGTSFGDPTHEFDHTIANVIGNQVTVIGQHNYPTNGALQVYAYGPTTFVLPAPGGTQTWASIQISPPATGQVGTAQIFTSTLGPVPLQSGSGYVREVWSTTVPASSTTQPTPASDEELMDTEPTLS